MVGGISSTEKIPAPLVSINSSSICDDRTEARKLFVYGTLRKGGMRSGHLEGCRLLRMMKIPGTLYRTPFGYPAAVFDETSQLAVWGELYELPPDSELFIGSVDRLEGVDEKLFSRSVVRLEEESFYVYEVGPELRRRISDADIIKAATGFPSLHYAAKIPFLLLSVSKTSRDSITG